MRLRLLLSFTIIVLVSVIGVVLIARQNAASEVRIFMFRGGMVGGEGLVAALEDHYRTYSTWQGVESLLDLSGHGWGPGGGGMGHGMGNMMKQQIRLADAQGKLIYEPNVTSPSGQLSEAELERAIPLIVNGQIVGHLVLAGGMGFTPADETRLVNRLSHAALTAGLIAGGISLLLALLLTYRLQRPIRELTQAAHQLAKGNLSQRVTIHGNGELSVLGNAFNQMAYSLQQAEESRRAMTADIAHELRTPLAVQRANLEALQDGIYPPTPDNLVPILEQNQLLTRLVEDLRTLALAEAGQLELSKVPTDLVALVKNLVDLFSPKAADQQVELHFGMKPDAPQSTFVLEVDPVRIEQIMSNLLSNALRYTPPGGHVKIELANFTSKVNITVHDNGPGIPADAMPYIFERFYRADSSRSRAEGGTGLGLAIARQLAQAHGGAITASNHPDGGAVFTFELPSSERGII